MKEACFLYVVRTEATGSFSTGRLMFINALGGVLSSWSWITQWCGHDKFIFFALEIMTLVLMEHVV